MKGTFGERKNNRLYKGFVLLESDEAFT